MAHAPDPQAFKRCFEPVVDARTRLLVLGSLPGERSLARQEYYGNAQNKFWHLMSEVTGSDLASLDYPSRLRGLLDHGVGLWDVVAQAQRAGSLDSGIRNHEGNDLPGLLARYPGIVAIAFNGATASRLGMKILAAGAARYRLLDLPSSSPAYTAPYAEKSRRWLALREHLAAR